MILKMKKISPKTAKIQKKLGVNPRLGGLRRHPGLPPNASRFSHSWFPALRKRAKWASAFFLTAHLHPCVIGACTLDKRHSFVLTRHSLVSRSDTVTVLSTLLGIWPDSVDSNSSEIFRKFPKFFPKKNKKKQFSFWSGTPGWCLFTRMTWIVKY
jgi:hypothetical protein